MFAEDIMEAFVAYVKEQKDFELSNDQYSSGSQYDFAIELAESFVETFTTHEEEK